MFIEMWFVRILSLILSVAQVSAEVGKGARFNFEHGKRYKLSNLETHLRATFTLFPGEHEFGPVNITVESFVVLYEELFDAYKWKAGSYLYWEDSPSDHHAYCAVWSGEDTQVFNAYEVLPSTNVYTLENVGSEYNLALIDGVYLFEDADKFDCRQQFLFILGEDGYVNEGIACVDGETTSCGGALAACGSDTDCCAGTCRDGVCDCKQEFQTCSNPEDCCTNLCEDGMCNCLKWGESCEQSSGPSCCTRDCRDSKCHESDEGGPCGDGDSFNCRLGLSCVNKICRCRGIDQHCRNDNECCSGGCIINPGRKFGRSYRENMFWNLHPGNFLDRTITGSCGCLGIGSNCTKHKECCSEECNPLNECACKSIDAACVSSDSCCTQNCDGDICRCRPYPLSCSGKFECCSGNCTEGVCQCSPVGYQCKIADECCTNLCGEDGKCDCRGNGTSCTSDGDCCGSCQEGICECFLRGDSCATGKECCTGKCKGGSCACRAWREICTEDAHCCTESCIDNQCTCWPENEDCDIHGQCCSKKCIKKKCTATPAH